MTDERGSGPVANWAANRAANRVANRAANRVGNRVGTALLLYAGLRVAGVAVFLVAAGATGRNGHAILVSWDSQWYRAIAANGYGYTRLHPDGRSLSDYAFFPLFPLLERWGSQLLGLRIVDVGLAISALSGLAAAAGIYLICARLYGHRVGLLTTFLWGALPVAIIESMPYTESLFTALAAWALLSVIRKRWLAAGVLALLAGLTRPTGAAVALAVMVAAAVELFLLARASAGERKPMVAVLAPVVAVLAPVAAIVISPLGWFGYVGWVGERTGSLLGYFEVTAGWENGVDGGAAFARWIAHLATTPPYVLGPVVIVAVALAIGLVVAGLRQGQPLPLVVYAGCLLALALMTSGYFGSKPRYLVPAFPLLLPVALWLGARSPRVLACLAILVTLVSAGYGALWLLGPGPP